MPRGRGFDVLMVMGAAGLIGRHVWSAVRDRDVIATTRDGAERDTIPLDVRDTARLVDVLESARPDVIIAAAAVAWVEQCEREPEATRSVNVEPVRELAAYATRNDALLAVFSSEYVFDGEMGSYAETDRVHPLNEYGRQKAEIEQIASGVARHLIIRTSGAYGEEPARRNFVWQVVDRLQAGRAFKVANDQLITPTFAPALATALVQLIDAGSAGIFHVPGPQIIARDAFAQMIATIFRLPAGMIVPVSTPELGLTAPRPRRAGLSDAKLRSVLGHPTLAPEEGLRKLAGGAGSGT